MPDFSNLGATVTAEKTLDDGSVLRMVDLDPHMAINHVRLSAHTTFGNEKWIGDENSPVSAKDRDEAYDKITSLLDFNTFLDVARRREKLFPDAA